VHLFDGLTPEQGAAIWETLFDTIIHPLEALPCPVVFAAHGLTLTAAFEIALACDLIVASPMAKFGLVETVVGLTPSMGGRSGWPSVPGLAAPANWLCPPTSTTRKPCGRGEW
jgi:enoyl-CoA hydratase